MNPSPILGIYVHGVWDKRISYREEYPTPNSDIHTQDSRSDHLPTGLSYVLSSKELKTVYVVNNVHNHSVYNALAIE